MFIDIIGTWEVLIEWMKTLTNMEFPLDLKNGGGRCLHDL